MTPDTVCPRCGAAAEGNYCSQCGAHLAAGSCASCGAALKSGALYCADCGEMAGTAPPKKPWSSRLPWILSGLGLVAFSIVIALLVQRQSVARTGDMTLTGGIPSSAEPSGGGGQEGRTMLTAEELAAMTPRQAADRLFERAMREHEGGNFESTAFFIDMGLRAYGAVPEGDADADMRFHVGLLRLLGGDSAGARASAEALLEETPDHLLGLLLASRAAALAGDEEAAEGIRARMRAAVADSGGIPDREEYEAHRALIESALAEPGS